LQLNRFSPFWAGECKQNDSQTEWSNVLWNWAGLRRWSPGLWLTVMAGPAN
jgi:hypothetical protein